MWQAGIMIRMIALLKGKVLAREFDRVILDVHGVGYELAVPSRIVASLTEGEEVTMYVAENIREDSYDLYGFMEPGERALYRRLISVNGVGAKMAHAILSLYDAQTLSGLIEGEEIARLSQVSGVGRKTAQRIVLELQGKLTTDAPSGAMKDDPAVLALVQLGYRADQASSALHGIEPGLETGERVRQALRELGR